MKNSIAKPLAPNADEQMLIAVIADDFTGAAEIAGIAFKKGFRTVVETDFIPQDTEVLIVAANTRDEPLESAKRKIAMLTKQLLELKPHFIFKKIDSVLRGNVAAEIEQQMAFSGKKRSLIIPANPSLGRIIKQGVYYLNGRPLNRAKFQVQRRANQQSAHIIDLINGPVTVVSVGEELPLEGLIVGNTVTAQDLSYWAAQLDNQTLMAGAANFFEAILSCKRTSGVREQAVKSSPAISKLFVCGSAFSKSRLEVSRMIERGVSVIYLSKLNLTSGDDSWIDTTVAEIILSLKTRGKVVLAMEHVLPDEKVSTLPEIIGNAFAEVTSRIVQSGSVEELLIEGGNTATAIFNRLNYKLFYPLEELATGVIRMQSADNERLVITVKPGSYDWPKAVWE